MKINRVIIRNILGIEELEFSAGQFVQIEGPNGKGKTSVLEAVKAALRGGHDGTLLRVGADKGEAVIILDDGTEIAKRVTAGKSNLTVIDGQGRKNTTPAETVRALADLLSVNPVEFLRAPKKERASILLEAMPIAVPAAKLAEAIAPLKVQIPETCGLAEIEDVRKMIFDERTGTGRAAKEKASTISQLRSALPQVPEVPGGAQGLVEQIQGADAAKDERLAKIQAKIEGIRQECAEKQQAIRDRAAEIIREAERGRDAGLETVRAELAEWEAKASKAREDTMAAHVLATADLRATLAKIQEAERQEARAAQARETIAKMEQEHAALEQEHTGQTQAIAKIDALKAEILAGLPIPGLVVQDGEILRDGVPFDRLNQAQQVALAVEVAKLRAGKIGVVCVDGLECMDADTFAEFKRQAIESGLQMFCTRVADNPDLTITNS